VTACQVCRQAPATVLLVAGGQGWHVCPDCAAEGAAAAGEAMVSDPVTGTEVLW
jgi:protein-arginine kinase activator protein McsA